MDGAAAAYRWGDYAGASVHLLASISVAHKASDALLLLDLGGAGRLLAANELFVAGGDLPHERLCRSTLAGARAEVQLAEPGNLGVHVHALLSSSIGIGDSTSPSAARNSGAAFAAPHHEASFTTFQNKQALMIAMHG